MPIEGDVCSCRNRTLSDGFQMKGTVVGGSTSRCKGSDARTCSHVVAGTHKQKRPRLGERRLRYLRLICQSCGQLRCVQDFLNWLVRVVLEKACETFHAVHSHVKDGAMKVSVSMGVLFS